MRILIFSDIHSDLGALRRLIAIDADYYASAGDLVSWERGLDDCGEILKAKSGKVWVKQVKTKTINLDLSVVRRILNLAARKWRDEQGLTWLETAPLISMLKVRDARAPYPLSWAEQRLLLPELP